MIIQPAHEQTRRSLRKRAYSGVGFGPRSFECIGAGMGLGIGLNSGSSSDPATPQTILSSVAWVVDMAQPGTLVSGKVHSVPDQSGNGVTFSALGADITYSASGGPNSQPYCQGDGTSNYLKNAAYTSPAPGTTPTFHYAICRLDAWVNGMAMRCGSATTTMGITAQASTPFFKALNGVGSGFLSSPLGSWMRVYCQFANSAVSDRLRIGSSDTGTGTAFGNNASGASVYLLGAGLGQVSLAYALDSLTVPSSGQITALDAWATARFGAIGF